MTDKFVVFDSNGQNITTTSDINANTIEIQGQSIKYKSSIRTIVDPSSNVGVSLGLLIPAGGGVLQSTLPIRSPTAIPTLGEANAYIDDPFGDYTLGANYIQINNPGKYLVNNSWVVVSNNSAERKSWWVMQVGSTLFAGPSVAMSTLRMGNPISFAGYSNGYISNSSGIMEVTQAMIGIQLAVIYILDNPVSDNEIVRLTSFSITRIE